MVFQELTAIPMRRDHNASQYRTSTASLHSSLATEWNFNIENKQARLLARNTKEDY